MLQFHTLGQQHFSFSITICFVVNFPQTTAVTLMLQLPTWFLILLLILCHFIRSSNHPWYSVACKNPIWLFVAFPDACQSSPFHCSSVLVTLGWAQLSLWIFYFLHFHIFEALRKPGSSNLSTCIVLQLNQFFSSSTRDLYITLQQTTWAKTILLINFHWCKRQHSADIISLKFVKSFFKMLLFQWTSSHVVSLNINLFNPCLVLIFS